MSYIIVIEGAGDGIGKSTQFKMLKNALLSDGYDVVTHHFPSYGTVQGKAVESYLEGKFGSPDSLSPFFVNSLYAVDRKITWETELGKVNDSSVILFDRYTTSSLIYQSTYIDDRIKKKEFINYIVDYEYNRLEIPSPDTVIFLNAPYEIMADMRAARKQNEGVDRDIHESDDTFMKKVYENANLISKMLGWDEIYCSEDGRTLLSPEEIHKKIYEIIRERI